MIYGFLTAYTLSLKQIQKKKSTFPILYCKKRKKKNQEGLFTLFMKKTEWCLRDGQ